MSKENPASILFNLDGTPLAKARAETPLTGLPMGGVQADNGDFVFQLFNDADNHLLVRSLSPEVLVVSTALDGIMVGQAAPKSGLVEVVNNTESTYYVSEITISNTFSTLGPVVEATAQRFAVESFTTTDTPTNSGSLVVGHSRTGSGFPVFINIGYNSSLEVDALNLEAPPVYLYAGADQTEASANNSVKATEHTFKFDRDAAIRGIALLPSRGVRVSLPEQSLPQTTDVQGWFVQITLTSASFNTTVLHSHKGIPCVSNILAHKPSVSTCPRSVFWQRFLFPPTVALKYTCRLMGPLVL